MQQWVPQKKGTSWCLFIVEILYYLPSGHEHDIGYLFMYSVNTEWLIEFAASLHPSCLAYHTRQIHPTMQRTAANQFNAISARHRKVILYLTRFIWLLVNKNNISKLNAFPKFLQLNS